MKKPSLICMLAPHIIHAAMSVAIIVIAAETLKKVKKIHKDMKIIGEKHGVLKLALHKLHEEKEKK